jgi:hypothetical protein
MQGITFKERDRAPHLTAPLKNNKGLKKPSPLKKIEEKKKIGGENDPPDSFDPP